MIIVVMREGGHRMKKIGIIGGLAWPSTADYYRLICAGANAHFRSLGHPMPTAFGSSTPALHMPKRLWQKRWAWRDKIEQFGVSRS